MIITVTAVATAVRVAVTAVVAAAASTAAVGVAVVVVTTTAATTATVTREHHAVAKINFSGHFKPAGAKAARKVPIIRQRNRLVVESNDEPRPVQPVSVRNGVRCRQLLRVFRLAPRHRERVGVARADKHDMSVIAEIVDKILRRDVMSAHAHAVRLSIAVL